MKLMPNKSEKEVRTLPPLPVVSDEEQKRIQENSARMLTRPQNEDYAASREFVVELLKLHYQRSAVDTLSALMAMIERALPGARVLPFFFDRWTLMLEGGIAGDIDRESIKSLLRDLKLDPQKLELTLTEGSHAQHIVEDGEVVAMDPHLALRGLTAVRPDNVGIRGAIAVPLDVDGETLGLLTVVLPTEPSAADRARLELIAAHGAIAIRNERDLHDAQKLNGIDPVTWIANRRAAIDQLSSEIERGRRFGHKVGAMLIEIDTFHEIAQGSGSAPANQLLRRVAMCISGGVRAPDFAGRVDEAQFLLVLPESDLNATATARERILERIGQLKGAGTDRLSFRSVMGVAPDDASSAGDLVEVLAQRMEVQSGGTFNRQLIGAENAENPAERQVSAEPTSGRAEAEGGEPFRLVETAPERLVRDPFVAS